MLYIGGNWEQLFFSLIMCLIYLQIRIEYVKYVIWII